MIRAENYLNEHLGSVIKQFYLIGFYPLPDLPPKGKELKSKAFPPWGKRERGFLEIPIK